MIAMQAFYTDLFSIAENGTLLSGLRRVARTSLKEILAVRSELAWDPWF